MLANLAYDAGTIVRWFEYSETDSTGGVENLKPVNSIEIFKAKKRSALEYLCLTKANVESLVFYSKNEDNSAGILFCADSNFVFKQDLSFLSKQLIVTVPHHGADANKNAYLRLKPYISSDTIFVRSDSKQSSKSKSPRPCKAFKALTNAKFCTICFPALHPKQDVVLQHSLGTGWVAQPNTYSCHCKL